MVSCKWTACHRSSDVIRELNLFDFAESVLSKCPHWDRLHPIFCDRPSMIPPFVSDSVGDLTQTGAPNDDGQLASHVDQYDSVTAPGHNLSYITFSIILH